jgi:hypothetical protein
MKKSDSSICYQNQQDASSLHFHYIYQNCDIFIVTSFFGALLQNIDMINIMIEQKYTHNILICKDCRLEMIYTGCTEIPHSLFQLKGQTSVGSSHPRWGLGEDFPGQALLLQ